MASTELTFKILDTWLKDTPVVLYCHMWQRSLNAARQSLPEGHDLAGEVAAAAEKQASQIDLCWVKARPIAVLAKTWLSQHPGTTMRQLAIRVTNTARRMGYATSLNTIQPILGGHQKRTRGFVYHALLTLVKVAPWYSPIIRIGARTPPPSKSNGGSTDRGPHLFNLVRKAS
jgi:hypothetical protein